MQNLNIIKPKALYAAETLKLINNSLLHNLGKEERDILGLKCKNNLFKSFPPPKKKLHLKIGKISVTLRKRPISIFLTYSGWRTADQLYTYLTFSSVKRPKASGSHKFKKIQIKGIGKNIDKEKLRNILRDENKIFQEASKRENNRAKLSKEQTKIYQKLRSTCLIDKQEHPQINHILNVFQCDPFGKKF